MKKILITLLALLAILIAVFCIFYNIMLMPIGENEEVNFIVSTGETFSSIAYELEEQDLIKSSIAYRLYVKFNKPKNLQAGSYVLNKNMTVKQIIEVLTNGATNNPEDIKLTFKEGKNMRNVANYIAENTNNTVEDVYNTLSDNEYLDSVIEKYWFLTDEIKNSDIYYSLEGYLFPETYYFNADVSVKEIFNTMLNQMEKELEPYKEQITNNSYTFHQLLTMASIVELEGINDSDRSQIAGVFYNRLNASWSLGSDVTTYYGAKIDLNERDLYENELNAVNAYNTRSSSMAGMLPVGPICNPGLVSILAALNPETSDYFYFVSDINGNTYFNRTEAEHQATKQKLISEGIWYTYE